MVPTSITDLAHILVVTYHGILSNLMEFNNALMGYNILIRSLTASTSAWTWLPDPEGGASGPEKRRQWPARSGLVGTLPFLRRVITKKSNENHTHMFRKLFYFWLWHYILALGNHWTRTTSPTNLCDWWEKHWKTLQKVLLKTVHQE